MNSKHVEIVATNGNIYAANIANILLEKSSDRAFVYFSGFHQFLQITISLEEYNTLHKYLTGYVHDGKN